MAYDKDDPFALRATLVLVFFIVTAPVFGIWIAFVLIKRLYKYVWYEYIRKRP